MQTVPALEQALMQRSSLSRVDLTQVSEFDSAALALLVALAARTAQQTPATRLAIDGASPALVKLARVYGVDTLLGLT